MAPPAKSTRSADRREQILDEAQRLFLEHGLDSTTTRQIALAVGISQPSLYAHFASRDAIAVELCIRAFGFLERRLRSVDQSLPSAQRLRELCRAYIQFGLEEPAAYRVAFMAEIAVDEESGMHRGLEAGLATFSILREAMTAHLGNANEAEVAAQSVWAGIHGLVAIFLTRPEFPFIEPGKLIETHLDRLLATHSSSAA
ncbi:TetR/AcrR family transcriptional regulator [Novosphingobium sp. ERN07]|uniref:TetR/AcrR family transcriptional regulator n=1 Tax=unclassified Novosphingobium TaxID=2644732 RepID=UPI000E54D2EE|nr:MULTISPECIES: TetR/AcrR family transcriptional regulator [unclassified Novosphingobium]AXU20898.1 TetR/AcrR family transcriptional regulator [Novosphingobium sp. THN1]NLR41725.1 TetR/AcrR family transcriptional regulator [Novosphingobium sp. ERW19]NLR70783.1 TetR/AcrR family transcriptional regulator [Novosphingobium sp. ERN07]